MGHYGGICKAISGVYARSRFPTRESTAARYLVATRKGVSRNHSSCQTLASLGAKSFPFQCLLKRNVEKKPLGPCVAYVQGCVELGTRAGALAMLAHNLACLIIEQPMVLDLLRVASGHEMGTCSPHIAAEAFDFSPSSRDAKFSYPVSLVVNVSPRRVESRFSCAKPQRQRASMGIYRTGNTVAYSVAAGILCSTAFLSIALHGPLGNSVCISRENAGRFIERRS